MPIQMFAMITEVSDQDGEVSQFTGPRPRACRAALTTPESLLSIHDQVDAETISGSSQGTRNRARRVAESRKCWLKKTARARPMLYWKTRHTLVNTTVWSRAGAKVGSSKTAR